MEELHFRLLNGYQRAFPLSPQPFGELAEVLQAPETAVIEACAELKRSGMISRLGAVFAPHRIGASTLAAMQVPEARLAAVAAIVSRFPEVNHNYEREHAYNLWFVVTAAGPGALQATLAGIEQACGLPLLRLPLEEEFHIDLGFSLQGALRPVPLPGGAMVVNKIVGNPVVGGGRGVAGAAAGLACGAVAVPKGASPRLALDAAGRRLLAALQEGLPFCRRPYQVLAERAGLREAALLGQLAAWLADGVIKRFGLVVRHHELGFTANAMVVHDIPDAAVTAVGRQLSGEAAVTLCYRRPRVLPAWRYNLFCMIHGLERRAVEAEIAVLRARHGLQEYPHAVLFSRTRFKQQGARYA